MDSVVGYSLTTEIRAKVQRTLVEVLWTDIDVAFTFLETARITREPAHAQRAVENAQIALQSIRHFNGRVTDPHEWQEIHRRANELENTINSFSNSFSD